MALESFASRIASRIALIGALAVVALPRSGAAQSSGDGFLFKRPSGSFSIHAGWARADAGSDVFSEATSQLTLDKGDFSSLAFGGDISYGLSSRMDLVVGADYMSSKKDSEFRDWVDNNDQPIEQSTNFRRVPLTVSLKYYIVDRGREVSRFAWIPSQYAPYVGVGGGGMYYRFRQEGDFVDFEDLGVRYFEIQSSGWTPMGQGMAGLDYTIGPWLALTGEARYSLAKARLDPDSYEGFEKIDLSGFTGTVGFKVRF
jgi:outer membrane protein W